MENYGKNYGKLVKLWKKGQLYGQNNYCMDLMGFMAEL